MKNYLFIVTIISFCVYGTHATPQNYTKFGKIYFNFVQTISYSQEIREGWLRKRELSKPWYANDMLPVKSDSLLKKQLLLKDYRYAYPVQDDLYNDFEKLVDKEKEVLEEAKKFNKGKKTVVCKRQEREATIVFKSAFCDC